MSYEQQQLEGAADVMHNVVVDRKNNSDSPSDENEYQTAFDQY